MPEPTFDDFMKALRSARGFLYRWRADYIKASMQPDCRETRKDEIQEWMQTKLVPAWAIEQIERMKFPNPTD